MIKRILGTLATVSALLFTASVPEVVAQKFVTVKDGHFERNGKPYYYVGTNFWYGAILSSEGQGGDRARLGRELDNLKANGIDNLRILVGSDGERGVKTKVEPTLQIAPGVYNDTILAGLDYLLSEMGKRGMVAVLYLNNSWEWSGGYGFYLEHAGAGKAPRPNEAGYQKYMDFVSQFSQNEKAQNLFYDYVRFIVGRKNRYTGLSYADDPAIMSWQIGNEPRAFSQESKAPFAKWLAKTSALIRSLDPNHLISIGSEGSWGCENDMELYRTICSDSNISYMNIHLWPYNWGWARGRHLRADLNNACTHTRAYINEHLVVSKSLGKPLVMEEFGFPRDGFSFSQEATTSVRDDYFDFVFGLIQQARKEGGLFAGCNFWGWGGEAQAEHDDWQVGDPYTGDPAQEAQGLNSVFASDASTLKVIKKWNDKLK